MLFVHPSIIPRPVLSLCLLNQIISLFTNSLVIFLILLPTFIHSLLSYISPPVIALPFSFVLLDHLSKYSPFSLLSHYSQAVIPSLPPLSRICLPQISLKIIILNKPPPLLSVFPFFSILTFCLFQCLTHELVSPPTEAITGQLAGRQRGSNSLTLGGLINLRITVVRQWKERYREDLGMEKEKKCMFNGGWGRDGGWVENRGGSKRNVEDEASGIERERGRVGKRKTSEDQSQFEEDGVWIEQEETLQTALVSELNYTQISQNVNATDRCGEWHYNLVTIKCSAGIAGPDGNDIPQWQ